MIGGRPLSDEDWLYPDRPPRPLRTLLEGRRRLVVGVVTVALLVGVSSTAPSGSRATQSVTGASAVLHYFCLLPAVASDIPFGSPIRLWTWNGAAWYQRNATGGPVSPVAVVAFDPVTETVLAVGARCSTSYCVSETWSWNGAGWQPSRPPHEPGFAF